MMVRLGTALGSLRARVAVLAVMLGFFAAYAWFDLREGGRSSSLLTTRLSTPSFYIAHFGGWFFWGCLGLDILLAAASAMLVVGSIGLYRSRKAAGGLCTSSATLLFGFAVFGCPGCMMPLFGTLGVALFANALPLFGLEFKLASIAVTLAAIAWVCRPQPVERDGAAALRPYSTP